jgi:hypothetical protein
MWHCQKLNKPRKQGRPACHRWYIIVKKSVQIVGNIWVCDSAYYSCNSNLLCFSFCAFFMNICAKLGQYSETRFFTGTTKRRVINLRSPGRLQCPPRLLCKWVAEAFCPAAKYPGCKFNHYDPTSAELTRGQGYNCSTLPYLHETLICPTLRIHLHINVLSSVQQLSARY